MEAVAFLENRQQYLAENTEAEGVEAGGAGDAGGVQGQSASAIKIEALKELTLTLLKEVESLKEAQPHDGRRHLNLHEEVRRFEAEMIRWALKRTNGHQRRAARLLGLKVTTLHAKIKRYRIQINAFAEETDLGLAAAAVAAAPDNPTGTGETDS
ncbi:MAG TPA: helix-turn-helix domain-containing protein [Pyrinomonadaceae bacterium]|nr:helix-turn-helix domain-containing protein [Pyrinomonadaceae bacterium]